MTVIELFIFILVLLALLSILVFTIKTGISPMPSSGKVVNTIIHIINNLEYDTVIDLGSGWGTLIIAIAKKYPGKKVIGYELSFIPWLITTAMKNIFQIKNLSIYRHDFIMANLSDRSIILCYLFPEGMKALKDKLSESRIQNCIIISNTFILPSYKPEKVIRLNDFFKTPIYLYRL